jgi:hypothetical protein
MIDFDLVEEKIETKLQAAEAVGKDSRFNH